ncbi:aldehyde dehydrogenase family protein, partial [Staphylococcus saprophyticus]|uniref:aldehyde dehydrogenase family protein n=1 Tax=Staphylococcus saprophyticus TaxID=29385 RepID=UPI0037045BD3
MLTSNPHLHKPLNYVLTPTINNPPQLSTSPHPIFLHQHIHHTFIHKFKPQIQQLTLPDPFHQSTHYPPIINQQQLHTIHHKLQNPLKNP